ncbi:MAG: hypothetical protein Q8K96_11660 [Rubrivivax sp.]|nr:hypothetical protein [Rubrivivax sp.]
MSQRARMRRALAASALLLACAPVQALGPRAPFEAPRPAAVAASGAETGPTAAPVGGGSTGLSGVHLAPSGNAALIDGLWWPLGGTPRGARLVAVQRHQVQLRHAGGRLETLALHPAAHAAPARAPNPSSPTPAQPR